MKKSSEIKLNGGKANHQTTCDEELLAQLQKRRDENEALKKMLGSLNKLQNHHKSPKKTKPKP
jgi:hypothetical protein